MTNRKNIIQDEVGTKQGTAGGLGSCRSSNSRTQQPNRTCLGAKKTLHVAPMLDVSTREFRQLFRILSKRCVLWTEMVVDETIVHSDDLDVHLGYEPETHPVICQIGGISPEFSGRATRVVERQYEYDEVNLNVDCPSDRVSGQREFGAILMKKKLKAMRVVEAMRSNARGPISVKCRVGIDELDDLDYVADFIGSLYPLCTKFYLHARKCVLGGLTPAQNRSVPPLNYPRVYEICNLFRDCEFWINGGISGLEAAKLVVYGTSGEDREQGCLEIPGHTVPCPICNKSNGSCTAPPHVAPPNLRGCMLGRAAMDNPSMFWDVDRYFYGEDVNPTNNRREVLLKYCEYLEHIYPRRCCDSDERITCKLPAPTVVRKREFCAVCRTMYTDEVSLGDRTVDERNDEVSAAGLVPSIETAAAYTDGADLPNPIWRGNCKRWHAGAKISSRVVDRALKPILGIFYDLPGNKSFRRACHELSRDLSVRNCGPGYILRKAMEAVPSELLDQAFVKTEDLVSSPPSYVASRNRVDCRRDTVGSKAVSECVKA